MCTAEALLIGHIAYVSLHVRGTMTKYKIHDVILGAFFYIANASSNSIVDWINKRESTCFICDSVNKTFNAYMKTFFTMYEKDPELKEKLKNTKGFCLDHLKVVLEGADTYLKGDKRKEFFDEPCNIFIYAVHVVVH